MLISNGEILEVLYGARHRLESPDVEFYFPIWTTCTCGHIYAATTGHKAANERLVAAANEGDERYAEIIQGVALALGWDGMGWSGWGSTSAANAAQYVSDATPRGPDGIHSPKQAVEVITQAIETIEAMQERDRRDVLAQTQRIVDGAVAPEHAPV